MGWRERLVRVVLRHLRWAPLCETQCTVTYGVPGQTQAKPRASATRMTRRESVDISLLQGRTFIHAPQLYYLPSPLAHPTNAAAATTPTEHASLQTQRHRGPNQQRWGRERRYNNRTTPALPMRPPQPTIRPPQHAEEKRPQAWSSAGAPM